MRVLIDTNVVLDFLQEREPFVENAARIFQQIDAGEIEGVITATTIIGVENGVTSIPSHSKPDMRLSPHPAPSLTAPLLRIQL